MNHLAALYAPLHNKYINDTTSVYNQLATNHAYKINEGEHLTDTFWRVVMEKIVPDQLEKYKAGEPNMLLTFEDANKVESKSSSTKVSNIELEHKARDILRAALKSFGIETEDAMKLTSVDVNWTVNADTHAQLAREFPLRYAVQDKVCGKGETHGLIQLHVKRQKQGKPVPYTEGEESGPGALCVQFQDENGDIIPDFFSIVPGAVCAAVGLWEFGSEAPVPFVANSKGMNIITNLLSHKGLGFIVLDNLLCIDPVVLGVNGVTAVGREMLRRVSGHQEASREMAELLSWKTQLIQRIKGSESGLEMGSITNFCLLDKLAEAAEEAAQQTGARVPENLMQVLMAHQQSSSEKQALFQDGEAERDWRSEHHERCLSIAGTAGPGWPKSVVEAAAARGRTNVDLSKVPEWTDSGRASLKEEIGKWTLHKNKYVQFQEGEMKALILDAVIRVSDGTNLLVVYTHLKERISQVMGESWVDKNIGYNKKDVFDLYNFLKSSKKDYDIFG